MSPEILLGFEFEFTSSFSQKQLKQKLTSDLGIQFGPYRKNKWRLKTDGSLDTKLLSHNPIELVSPPQDSKKAIAYLKLVFKWMKDNNCKTNNTTGLHINVSFKDPDLNLAIDPVKLIMITPQNAMLTQFKRQRNKYCSSYEKIIEEFKYNYRNYHYDNWRDVVTVLRKTIFFNCNRFKIINFRPLSKSNKYIEFRPVGNKNYHLKTSEIISIIKKMIDLTVASASDTYKQKTYKRAVLDLVNCKSLGKKV